MSELLFIVKSFVLTILIVIFMQVKVGETTIEEKTLMWIESSPIILPLQEVVQGGVKFIREGWQTVFGNLNSKFFSSVNEKNTPGKRDLNLVLERSQNYLRDKAEKLKEKATEKMESTRESIRTHQWQTDESDSIKTEDL
ncbi:MAG: hypothetical protein KDD58_01450 [Bdellovibrionales bacterium]|nr:hypothetical protein [Bdellovibrionales bacterium]